MSSASRAIPSKSSESAGSAALARLEAQERRGQPLSGPGARGRSLGSATPTASGSGGSVGTGEAVKKTCSQLPPEEEPIPMEVNTVELLYSDYHWGIPSVVASIGE